MKAIILAAGKGTRMRDLTAHTPKPMLMAAGKPLIEYQLVSLVKAGIKDIVINHARFGQQIEDYLGNGSNWGATIEYSREGDEPLETAGGIIKALPLLGEGTFLAVNADVWSDYDYTRLAADANTRTEIVLVQNPEHNPEGDFSIDGNLARNHGSPKYTFAGIGRYHSDLFAEHKNESKLSLTPIIRNLADKNRLRANFYDGKWIDVGTPERLAALCETLKSTSDVK